MKSTVFIILFLLFSAMVSAQNSNRKIIKSANCSPLKVGSVINEELPLTEEKELTSYLISKHPKPFSKTSVELNLILFPNGDPCARRIIISDSTKITSPQIDTLLQVVLKYPGFKKIKFASDKPKELTVIIATNKKRKPEGFLLPAFVID